MSIATQPKLTICELLQETAGLTADQISLVRYYELLQRLDVPSSLLEQHYTFKDDSYARNLIFVTPRFEMLVMCWQPGQFSSVHDHLDSFAVIKVLRGTLSNSNYRVTNKPVSSSIGLETTDLDVAVERINEEFVPAGDWLSLDQGAIHKMGNHQNSGEQLITLHFYAKPLREVYYYFPEQQRRERKKLIYSLMNF